MLGWYKALAEDFVVFWCQCSTDGWDEYAGSKFVVEFQRSRDPIIGARSAERKRLSGLLDGIQLEKARRLQNDVISQLHLPPRSYNFFHTSPAVTDWFLRKFELEAQPYTNSDDVWLRYHQEADVRRWAEFILECLPALLTRFAPDLTIFC